MYQTIMEVGDLHAYLWEGLTIISRRVDGPEDVTIGDHIELGLCVVSHFGFEDRIAWWSERKIDLG